MSENLFRRNPTNNVFELIKSRKGLLNSPQTVNGRSVQMRNPVFVTVTGHDKSCGGGGSKTISSNDKTWDTTYGNNFKPNPIIESLVFEYGGDYGLARGITVKIICFSITDFTEVQRYFLLPGNEVDVNFGYSNSWGSDNQNVNLKEFTIATFGFNTTPEGHWICEFKAVSSATAIKNLEMQLVVCNGCNEASGTGQSGDSGPLRYINGTDNEQHPVKGVAQLIASDAQRNGNTSIDEMQDGEVILNFTDFKPMTKYDKSAAIVVYTGDHIRDRVGKFMAWSGGILKSLGMGSTDEVETANNQVYVSLGYIINRIINDQLLRSFSCTIAHDRDKFNKLKVEFHPKYSKCKISKGITSGDPLHVLTLGLGNYKNVKNDGKNFDSDCKNLGAVKCIDENGNVKLQNILIHRDVITSAFTLATQNRQSNSDNTDVKDTKEEVINVIDFFEKIADEISSCTGGAIALRLVENPDDTKTLIVVDQNYGESDVLKCMVFDPIDADGNTRTCTVQSNVGSQEYKAAMFVGASKRGDPVSALRKCTDKLKDKRIAEHDKARSDRFAIIKNPGNLGRNNFAGTEINALKSVMSRLHRANQDAGKIESLHYPGLSINIEINGVYGIEPGMAISSTQVPTTWRTTMKSYFMVTKVTHTIQQSDWVTNIEGILSYYDNISYIVL